uniref:Uncharacterized protein n=1 Tax=candidate division CPR3 bacterium TaxID=2268181 RepID=A0A7V3N478_UNCC3
MLLLEDKKKCKVCLDVMLRYKVAEMYASGMSFFKIRTELKKENIKIAERTIRNHILEHEGESCRWIRFLGKYKFDSAEERRNFEGVFLSRVSLVTELWDKYRSLSQLWDLIVGEDELNPNARRETDKVVKIFSEMRACLNDLIKLQRERDLIQKVAKVVLFMCADGMVEKLSFVLHDLPESRREIVGEIIKEEVGKALEYAKDLAEKGEVTGKTDVQKMMDKVSVEYSKLVGRGEGV